MILCNTVYKPTSFVQYPHKHTDAHTHIHTQININWHVHNGVWSHGMVVSSQSAHVEPPFPLPSCGNHHRQRRKKKERRQWQICKQKTVAGPVKLLFPVRAQYDFFPKCNKKIKRRGGTTECILSFVNIPVHCNVKVFIWLYPSLPVQLSFILERSVGSRKRGPVCPEPRLLSSTKHSAGIKGECSLGSQVLISPQTDMLLNSLKCQKRWVYLSCWSSWLHMASWATHLWRWPNGHLRHIRSGS